MVASGLVHSLLLILRFYDKKVKIMGREVAFFLIVILSYEGVFVLHHRSTSTQIGSASY